MRISDWSSDVCSADLEARIELECTQICLHCRGKLLARFQQNTELEMGAHAIAVLIERTTHMPQRNVVLLFAARLVGDLAFVLRNQPAPLFALARTSFG